MPSWWLGGELVPNLGMDDCSTFGYMIEQAQRAGILVIVGTIPPWGVASPWQWPNGDPDSTGAARYARIDALNAWIKTLPGVTVVDYHSALVSADGQTYQPQFTVDGVHPNSAGAKAMFSTLLSTPIQ